MFGKSKKKQQVEDFDPNYNPYATTNANYDSNGKQMYAQQYDENGAPIPEHVAMTYGGASGAYSINEDELNHYTHIETKKEKKARKKKEKAKKKKNASKRYNFKAIQAKIEGYGFHYSFMDFAKTTALFVAACIIVGHFLKLQGFYVCALILVAFAMLPAMIISQFKYIYEQKRFSELVVYMEQMAYSFKKTPKILLALKDTAEVTSGKMNKLVNAAIYHIENTYSEHVYEEALEIIQSEYECSRLMQLHKFLVKIEARGGEFQNSMDILLDDISAWSKSTFIYQKDRADIKRKIMISLILSMCICSTTIFMIPDGVDFTTMPVYQISTVSCLAIFLGIYTLTQTKLNGSWLENDAIKDEEEIVKNYNIALTSVDEDSLKKAKKKVAIVSPVLVYAIFTKNMTIGIVAVVLMFFMYQQPKIKIKNATSKTVREIEKEFPSWGREIALNLQTENVYQAMYLTLEDCPIILKAPLLKFFDECNRLPESIVPYNNFLCEFNIPEVGRMMKNLYSLNEYGTQNADIQINKVVVQLNAMREKEEQVKNEDSLAGIGILTLAPMLLGSVKMLIDLALLMTSFIGLSSGLI